MSDLNFESVELIRVPFKIGDKSYFLQEADGEAGAEYRDAMAAGFGGEIDDEGNITNRRYSGTGVSKAEIVLLSHCVYEGSISDTDNAAKVPQETVKAWPDRISQQLVEKVKEISELGKYRPTQSGGPKSTMTG